MQREAGLNAKGYSERDERRILDALGRGLLKEFPNPERTGCPGTDVVRRIAFHEMPLAQAEVYLDHLTSCSPCYKDFSRLRESYRVRRRRILLAVAASILLVATTVTWTVIRKSNNSGVQEAVLDLRNRSVARGQEQIATENPLEIRRSVSRVEIYLPLGSNEGSYDIRIATPQGNAIFTTSGEASLKDGVTSLHAFVNLSSISPGGYVLQIRKPSSEWNSYAVVLR